MARCDQGSCARAGLGGDAGVAVTSRVRAIRRRGVVPGRRRFRAPLRLPHDGAMPGIAGRRLDLLRAESELRGQQLQSAAASGATPLTRAGDPIDHVQTKSLCKYPSGTHEIKTSDQYLDRQGRPVTRASIIVVAFAALAIDACGISAHAAAWCLVGYSGRDCSYHTFEQCLSSRAGGSSFCEQNPSFAGSSSNRPPRAGQRR